MSLSKNVGAEAPLARYRVLLVDDDATVLRSMAATLEFEHELAVDVCTSAGRALDLIASGDFHVVCSDYSMPGMTGLELLEHVQGLPRAVGCLLVTGATSFVSRNADGAGDHYVLVKPVDPARLSTMILQLARTAEIKRGGRRVTRPDERKATR